MYYKKTSLIVLLGILSTANVLLSSEPNNYIPRGPNEIANLEKGLYELLPTYVKGIYPKQEIIASLSINEQNLKEDTQQRISGYKDDIEKWLKKVLVPELLPEEFDKNGWLCMHGLHWNNNYIIGRFSSSADNTNLYKDANSMFQASRNKLAITVASDKICYFDPNTISDTELVSLILKILQIPKEKEQTIKIDRSLHNIDSTKLCHGKIRVDWDDEKSSIADRKWWSYIPFWYRAGTVYFDVYTIDWKYPPARIRQYELKDRPVDSNETSKSSPKIDEKDKELKDMFQ